MIPHRALPPRHKKEDDHDSIRRPVPRPGSLSASPRRSAPLGNVRTIAQKAAAAWAAEALYAQGREQRQARVRAFRTEQTEKERAAPEQLDLASGEKPDRGRAASALSPHPL